jgi:hypothetical protein
MIKKISIILLLLASTCGAFTLQRIEPVYDQKDFLQRFVEATQYNFDTINDNQISSTGTASGTVEYRANKGIAGGYASLDAFGKVPTSEAYYSGTGGGGVSSVTASLPLSSSGGANPNITIDTSGFLTSTALGTFETIIAHNASLANYATLNGLATYETTSSVISRLGTFETIAGASSKYIPLSQNTLLKEPTGFATPEGASVVYNSVSRTITITGDATAYYRGNVIPELVSGWVSPTHDATNGVWFLSYNGSTFSWSQTAWTFDKLQIAFVYYTPNSKFALRETHGLMQYQAHEVLHDTIGTFLDSGGDMTGITLGSTTASVRRPTISQSVVMDEDLKNTLVGTSTAYSQFFLGEVNTVYITIETADVVPLNGNQPLYNLSTGGNWGLTGMLNNNYMCVWLVAVPVCQSNGCQKYRYLWVTGQSQGNLASQQALSPANITLGGFNATEYVFIGRLIIQYIGGNWNIAQQDKIIGSRTSQVTTSAGYLSAVTTDNSLTGSGTVGSPLSVSTALGTFDTISSRITAISTALGTVELLTRKDVANGYAGLDSFGKVPTAETYSSSSPGGGVTSVTASLPLSSSGGNTPNITIDTSGFLTSQALGTFETTSSVLTRFATYEKKSDIVQKYLLTPIDTTVATPTNATGESFTIGTGESWSIDASLKTRCSSTGGVKVCFSIPANTTLRARYQGSTNAITTHTSGTLETSGLMSLAMTTIANTVGYINIQGVVWSSTGFGNVQLQYQSTTASQKSTLEAGSILRAFKIY